MSDLCPYTFTYFSVLFGSLIVHSIQCMYFTHVYNGRDIWKYIGQRNIREFRTTNNFMRTEK